MKKIITKADIKKMGLTEDEQFYMECEAESINTVQNYGCDSTMYFQYGTTNNDKRNAYNKAVIYFIKKFIGESDMCSLRKCAEFLSEKVFFTSVYNMIPYLKGLAYNSKGQLFISDNFGLDYLTINK